MSLGATFEPRIDASRIDAQRLRVMAVIADGQWHTLNGIAALTDDPEASVSARLRDFRKEQYGGHTIQRRRVHPSSGLHEYRLVGVAE